VDVYKISGFHGREDVDVGLVGSNEMWTFWRNMLPPTSGLKMEFGTIQNRTNNMDFVFSLKKFCYLHYENLKSCIKNLHGEAMLSKY
jgi:hypothetical protein